MAAYRSPNLQVLFASSKALQYFRGDTIGSTKPDGVIAYVKNGYIKRHTVSSRGTSSVQIIYGPQDIFSLTNVYSLLLGQNIYEGKDVFYYQAMSDVWICRLDAKTFKKAVAANPELYKELFIEAGHHLQASIKNLENIGLLTISARVAHQLAYFAQEFGQPTSEGIEIKISLTQQDMADILSVARETVSRAITRLRAKGLIEIKSKYNYIVRDIDALSAVAYR